jgi:hypothetical protein
MPYTSDDLVTEVRRRTRLPTATDITDAEILQYGDQEMQGAVGEVMRSSDPSFWVATHTATVVSGTATYAIPRMAIGAGIERVEIQDGSGNRREVVPVHDSDTWRWANGGRDPYWPAQLAYTLEATSLRLWPTPTSALGSLRVRYHRQPSALILASAANAISSATSTTVIKLVSSTVPATISGAGSIVDVVAGYGAHEVIAAELQVASVAGTNLNLDSSTPVVTSSIATTRINVPNDYVCPTGQTVYPQVPQAAWPLLVSRVCVAVLEALGHREAMMAASAIAQQRETAARAILAPRSRDVAPIMIRSSYLRRGR